MDELPETSELLAFVKTVDANSMSGAANEIGVPRATISRRLERLEERLGVRLLHRNTRRITMTDAGQELYRHARALLSAVRDADAAVRRSDDVRGLLRVSLPPFRGDLLQSLLLSFLERYPEVQLEVHVTTLHLDLIASGYDVALRAGPEVGPGLYGRVLVRSESRAVASPAYLATAGLPLQPDNLLHHACLVGFARGERPTTHWPLTNGQSVRITPRLACNDLDTLHLATLAGKGIALLPRLLVDEDLASGRLQMLLPEHICLPMQVAVLYPDRAFVSPAVRAFVNWTLEWATRIFPEGRRAM